MCSGARCETADCHGARLNAATWIAPEAYEYPQCAAGDQGRDRILVFEDTTGDGHFDSRKVFAEGLNLVSGLEVGFGGVWVLARHPTSCLLPMPMVMTRLMVRRKSCSMAGAIMTRMKP